MLTAFRRHPTLFIVLGVVAVFILNFFFRAPTIVVAPPHRGPAIEAVYATGTVEGSEMFPIAPRISARLIELKAREGDSVKQSDLLCRLENEELQATVNQLKVQEQYTRREYERLSKLVERDAVARSLYEKSNADWLSARAALQAAEAQLSYAELRAPADGQIVRRDGEIGELIPAAKPIFWMTTSAPLRVSAEVDEEDIAQVRNGQPVLIRADAFPKQTFSGFVQSVTPKGDPVARSFRVRIGFHEGVPLQLGMTTEVNIILREVKDALLVPSSALDEDHVWLVEHGRLIRKNVQIGVRGDANVEVVDGVSADDLVVVLPDDSLKEGERVRAFQAK